MKKLLVLLVLVVCLSQVHAQEKGDIETEIQAQEKGNVKTQTHAQEGDIEIGVLGGLNISTLYGFDEANTKSRVGANLGLSVDYYFSDQFSLRVKFLYDSKGGEEEEYYDYFNKATTSSEIKGVYRLNYLSIPIMANLHFGGASKNFNLNFGPYLAFLLSANGSYEEKYIVSGNVSEKYNTNNIKGSFNTLDFGIAFGLGYKFNLSDNINLFLEYEGQVGLVNAYDDYDTAKNFRHSFNVGLSYHIPFKQL